jgi:hypothetical protein
LSLVFAKNLEGLVDGVQVREPTIAAAAIAGCRRRFHCCCGPCFTGDTHRPDPGHCENSKSIDPANFVARIAAIGHSGRDDSVFVELHSSVTTLHPGE